MEAVKATEASLMTFMPCKAGRMTSKETMYWLFFVILCAMYLIGIGDAFAAGAAPDPSAPLDMLKTARQRAQSSNLSVASATTGASNVASIVLIAMGMIGVTAASYSGYSLYQNVQQGEQARGSNTTYVIALVVGAALTLIAVIIGVVSNFITAT